jgi:hypothetical protein
MCACSGPTVRNYNYYSAPAPPLIGGYGYGGYGYGGGISLFPSFGVPIFYGGGLFNFFIFMVSPASLSKLHASSCSLAKLHASLGSAEGLMELTQTVEE